MVLVVFDENGKRLEFETWQKLQEYFDNLEKEKIKKNARDKTYFFIKGEQPIRVDFE